MSILDKISKPQDKPVICTITGDAGIGKTSLAATFPKPIFIRVEDGLQAIPEDVRPDAFPLISSIDDLWEQVAALITGEHAYQTLVVDSVTQLDAMLTKHIIESDSKKPRSINQALGGYGAGASAVGELHQRLRRGAEQLRDRRGMHVVFIAHADVTTVDLPDQDGYSRYDLRLPKKSASPYVDNVDMVAYIKQQMFVVSKDGERSKATDTGKRIVTTYTTAANISKNRYGITEDLPFEVGVNPFTHYIKTLRG